MKEKKYLGSKAKKILGIFFVLSFLSSFVLFTPVLFADSLGFNDARTPVEDHTDPGLSNASISNSASNISTPTQTTQYTNPTASPVPASYQSQQNSNAYTPLTGNSLGPTMPPKSTNSPGGWGGNIGGGSVPPRYEPIDAPTFSTPSTSTLSALGKAVSTTVGSYLPDYNTLKNAASYASSQASNIATSVKPYLEKSSYLAANAPALQPAPAVIAKQTTSLAPLKIDKPSTMPGSQGMALPDLSRKITTPAPVINPAITALPKASYIKPDFNSTAALPSAAPVMAKLPNLQPKINSIPTYNALPNYSTAVKPYNPGFTKISQFTPIAAQSISIKPQLMQLGAIKPLNSYLDAKITQMPQAITIPKFIPADFSGVKKLDIIRIKQAEPIKITLGQTGFAFNKDLKPVFLPIKNPITTPIAQPVLIKPQWVKLDSSFSQMTKPVLPKLEAISALKQPASLKPVFTYIKPIAPVMLPLDSKLTLSLSKLVIIPFKTEKGIVVEPSSIIFPETVLVIANSKSIVITLSQLMVTALSLSPFNRQSTAAHPRFSANSRL